MESTATAASAEADPSEPPTKRERNKADKHRRIVQTARQLFEDKGFEAATTAEISTAAGIGTGTLYLYVDSKEDLLVEVFLGDANGAWTEAIASIDPADSVGQQIVSVFHHVADFHLLEPKLSRAYFRDLPFTTGTVRDRCSAFQDGLDRRLAEILAEARTRGELAPDIDCHALAVNLFATWYLHMQRRLGRGVDRDLHGAIERSVRTALVGVT